MRCILLIALLAISGSGAADNQERWLYEQRPLSFGVYSEPVFVDSRLGPGCWQKRFAPNARGYHTPRFTGVPCPAHLRTGPMPCGRPHGECSPSPNRQTGELLFPHMPYEVLKSMTKGTVDLLRNKQQDE